MPARRSSIFILGMLLLAGCGPSDSTIVDAYKENILQKTLYMGNEQSKISSILQNADISVLSKKKADQNNAYFVTLRARNGGSTADLKVYVFALEHGGWGITCYEPLPEIRKYVENNSCSPSLPF